MLALRVTQPFGEHAVGDTIKDEDAVKAALENSPAFVVRVMVEDQPDASTDAPSEAPAPAEPEPAVETDATPTASPRKR